MIVFQISGLYCYPVPIEYRMISAHAIISTYVEQIVGAPIDYTDTEYLSKNQSCPLCSILS